MKTIFITYAVKEELTPLYIEDYDIRYILTGIGKTSSALRLTQALTEQTPDLVLNIGTAGTIKHNVGDFIICRNFVDRDLKSTNLPALGHEVECTSLLPGGMEQWGAGCKEGVCNTGDSFVTELSSLAEDVVDMESYAQALVCNHFDVPFVSVKYVTDIIGQNSVQQWEEKLSDARRALSQWLEEKLQGE